MLRYALATLLLITAVRLEEVLCGYAYAGYGSAAGQLFEMWARYEPVSDHTPTYML